MNMVEVVKYECEMANFGHCTFYYIPKENSDETVHAGNIFEQAFHKDDGPAVIWGALKEDNWYQYGHKHRYDGPATSFIALNINSGEPEPRERWYIRGTQVNSHAYQQWIKEMEIDLKNLSDEDKTLIDLKWK